MVDLSPICPSIALGNPQFVSAACATPPTALVQITADTSFDTDLGTSNAKGMSCVHVHSTGSSIAGNDLCVVAAASIVVHAGFVLSAHGSLPFALFAHSITIEGSIDVASHLGGQTGAGSLTGGCIPGKLPTGGGGGRGGDDGSSTPTGATGGGTFGVTDIGGGGCGGTRGGTGDGAVMSDGGIASGGRGGGAIWIASLTGDLLLEAGARINASGAGGLGGKHEGEGGAGGGAGGLIVLQAPHIQLNSGAVIFANGGHGGGGTGQNMGDGFTDGADGTDPSDPTSGGGGGTGGLDGGVTLATQGGDGGPGFPMSGRDGQSGTTDGHGGGGGGGAPGAIRVVAAANIAGPNVSPPPLLLQ